MNHKLYVRICSRPDPTLATTTDDIILSLMDEMTPLNAATLTVYIHQYFSDAGHKLDQLPNRTAVDAALLRLASREMIREVKPMRVYTVVVDDGKQDPYLYGVISNEVYTVKTIDAARHVFDYIVDIFKGQNDEKPKRDW